MAEGHLSFSTQRPAEGEELQPISFDIDGEVFWCKPMIAGSVLMERMGHLSSDGGQSSALSLLGFFDDAMEPDEHKRFRAYVDDEHNYVDGGLLSAIFRQLLAEYSRRPFGKRRASSNGQVAPAPTSRPEDV